MHSLKNFFFYCYTIFFPGMITDKVPNVLDSSRLITVATLRVIKNFMNIVLNALFDIVLGKVSILIFTEENKTILDQYFSCTGNDFSNSDFSGVIKNSLCANFSNVSHRNPPLMHHLFYLTWIQRVFFNII